MRYQVDEQGGAGLRKHRIARDRTAARPRAARSPIRDADVTGRPGRPDAELLAVAARPTVAAGRRRPAEGSRDRPSTPPAATGGWPPTASGRCIRAPPPPWSRRCIDGLRPRAGGAGVRSLLRGRAVRRRPGRRRRAGLGRRVEPAGDRARPRATCPAPKFTAGKVERVLPDAAEAHRPGGSRPAPHRRRQGRHRRGRRSPPASDRLRGLRSGRPGPRSRLAPLVGGYRPTSIRGFDLFPMTHHLEAVAHPASLECDLKTPRDILTSR